MFHKKWVARIFFLVLFLKNKNEGRMVRNLKNCLKNLVRWRSFRAIFADKMELELLRFGYSSVPVSSTSLETELVPFSVPSKLELVSELGTSSCVTQHHCPHLFKTGPYSILADVSLRLEITPLNREYTTCPFLFRCVKWAYFHTFWNE